MRRFLTDPMSENPGTSAQPPGERSGEPPENRYVVPPLVPPVIVPGSPPVNSVSVQQPEHFAVNRVEEVTQYLIVLIDTLLLLRFILRLFGASPRAPFVQLLYAITYGLVAPFDGIFPTVTQGNYVFEPSDLVAIPVYMLIGWAIITGIRVTGVPQRHYH